MSRANRYGQIRSVGSRSKGLGRRGKLDLISAVVSGSGGWGSIRAGKRRRAGEPAGEGQTGVPRLGLDHGLAVAHVRDIGDALVALAGLKEVRGGAGSAAAGRRGETPVCARTATGVHYRLH